MAFHRNLNEITSFAFCLLKSNSFDQMILGLPEARDIRVLEAACFLAHHTSVRPHLIGDRATLLDLAKKQGIPLQDLLDRIIISSPEELTSGTAAGLLELSTGRGKPLTKEAATSIATDPLYQAGILLHSSKLSACVAGSEAPTSAVIRAGLKTVGLLPGIQTVSGSFVMERSDHIDPRSETPTHEAATCYLYADSAIVIDPDVHQLVDIASASVKTFQSLFPERQPAVAFLSFSTKGSAKHASCEKMAKAAALFAERHQDVLCDGELQFDAALMKEIGERKAKGSPIPGKANIFIFPDLNAGNISYKITQRLGGFEAYGPIVQGLAKPYFDLSRGASWQDIVSTSLIALKMAKSTQEI